MREGPFHNTGRHSQNTEALKIQEGIFIMLVGPFEIEDGPPQSKLWVDVTVRSISRPA